MKLFLTSKYIPATNTRGARIRIWDSCFRKYRYYPYDHAETCAHSAAAQLHCEKYHLDIKPNMVIVDMVDNEHMDGYYMIIRNK